MFLRSEKEGLVPLIKFIVVFLFFSVFTPGQTDWGLAVDAGPGIVSRCIWI